MISKELVIKKIQMNLDVYRTNLVNKEGKVNLDRLSEAVIDDTNCSLEDEDQVIEIIKDYLK